MDRTRRYRCEDCRRPEAGAALRNYITVRNNISIVTAPPAESLLFRAVAGPALARAARRGQD